MEEEKNNFEKVMEEAKKEAYFFAEVKMFSGRYHIFKTGEKVSLCKKHLLPSDLQERDKSYVSGQEKLQKGDCKTCFKKAGLLKINSEDSLNSSQP